MKLFICLLLCFQMGCLFGHEIPDSPQSGIQVLKENILITDEGLFIIDEGYLVEVDEIYFDHKKLCVKKHKDLQAGKIWDECDNGHKIYHQACQGCANWWCLFRCKCYSPWTGE